MADIKFVDGYVNVTEFNDGGAEQIEDFSNDNINDRVYKLKVRKKSIDKLPKDDKGFVYFEMCMKRDKTGFYLKENDYMNKRITEKKTETTDDEDVPF